MLSGCIGGQLRGDGDERRLFEGGEGEEDLNMHTIRTTLYRHPPGESHKSCMCMYLAMLVVVVVVVVGLG